MSGHRVTAILSQRVNLDLKGISRLITRMATNRKFPTGLCNVVMWSEPA